jgi:hypothetical protein
MGVVNLKLLSKEANAEAKLNSRQKSNNEAKSFFIEKQ